MSTRQVKKRTTETLSAPNFFAKRVKDTALGVWKEEGNGSLLYFTTPFAPASSKVAAFDLDGTLINVDGPHVHPKGRHDWKLFTPDIPARLKTLHDQGYKIVIISNQAGLKRPKTGASNPRKPEWKGKIEDIVRELNIPIQVYAAIEHGVYRKPSTGMWQHMRDHCNDGFAIDMTDSFYIGDAAGRAAGWKSGVTRKDHSAGDRKMALNLNLPFHTPEEYFFSEAKAPFSLGIFDPIPARLASDDTFSLKMAAFTQANKGKQEVVLLVGSPASGKSSLYRQFFAPLKYEHINQDELKTKPKCVKMCKAALETGYSIVIDNTNADKPTRALYLALAKEAGVPCRLIWLQTPDHICKHNNIHRLIHPTDGEEPKGKVPDIAFRTFTSRFDPPVKAEGYTDILPLPFVPTFSSKKHQEGWSNWLD